MFRYFDLKSKCLRILKFYRVWTHKGVIIFDFLVAIDLLFLLMGLLSSCLDSEFIFGSVCIRPARPALFPFQAVLREAERLAPQIEEEYQRMDEIRRGVFGPGVVFYMSG